MCRGEEKGICEGTLLQAGEEKGFTRVRGERRGFAWEW